MEDLKIQFFFLWLENDKEYVWNKPTLNGKLCYEMFSERTDLYQNKFFSLFGSMEYCPNKRIYIRALSQLSHKKRKDFLLFLMTVVSKLFPRLKETFKTGSELLAIPWM